MAVFNMKVDPNVPISRSLGFNPLGVLVDNITAYWLYFPQADAYCPPFTQGWTSALILNTAGYGYMEIKTPIGQTIQSNIPPGVSQFVNITWTDSDVAFSPGQPSDVGQSVDPGDVGTSSVVIIKSGVFSGIVGSLSQTLIGGFTINNKVNTTLAAGINTYPIIFPVPNKRIRVLTLTVSFQYSSAPSGADWVVYPSDTNPAFVNFYFSLVGEMSPFSLMTLPLVFNPGLDFDIGLGVNCNYTPHWANVGLKFAATYQEL